MGTSGRIGKDRTYYPELSLEGRKSEIHVGSHTSRTFGTWEHLISSGFTTSEALDLFRRKQTTIASSQSFGHHVE